MREDLEPYTPGGKRRFLHSLLLLFLIFLGVPLLFAFRGWNREPLLFQMLFPLILGGSFFLWERGGKNPEALQALFALPERGKRRQFLFSSLLAGILLQGISLLLAFLTRKVFLFLELPFKEQYLVTFLKALPPGELFLCFIPILLLAPLSEEWVFRHTIYKEAEKEFSPLWALLWQGGLFAFVHFNAPVFPGLFLLGIFLGWNVKRCGTLWGGILPHFFFNLTGLLLLLLLRQNLL